MISHAVSAYTLDSLRFIDITATVAPDFPVWPGAPRFEIHQKTIILQNGAVKTDSQFSMITHCGTHIDAPLHFSKKGISVDRLSADILLGSCRVFEHSGSADISCADLSTMDLSGQTRVLFKTHNSARQRARTLTEDYISLTQDAISYLIAKEVNVLGIDGFAIGSYGQGSDDNHTAFCGAGGVILEMLDLNGVAPGDYYLVALPMKIGGAEAAPARVLLGHCPNKNPHGSHLHNKKSTLSTFNQGV